MSASIFSFEYSGFVERTEDNQKALIIIVQPISNSHFLRLLFIFDDAIFWQNLDQKETDVTRPAIVSKSS